MPTAFKRGEVRLANFNPSKGTEAGKIRPCIILQSDLLNDIDHPSTMVIPLTSRILDDAAPLRSRIARRDDLEADSDAMIDQVRTVDNRRLTSEPLTRLTPRELAEIEEYLKIVLGLSVG
ncbi:MAG: type II toxin-antitoxin system PemK/MazF family toxin [Xanthomonadales bacterium]|nr:type II toxin-antitoxin system PemK/MazF family toxin [Xanthomonadales bacterium]